MSSVATSSFSAYVFSGVSSESSPAIASRTFAWPRTTFSHVGEFASSKSAMKTRAPELSALIIIFRSTGPVISQRRSTRSARRRRDAPVALADLARLGEEAGILAGVETHLPLLARLEQLEPPRIELAVEPLDERETFARQGLLGDAHAGACSFVNCASSVEPLSASVSLSGETACVTRSK